MAGPHGIVDARHPAPPIVVGATGPRTIEWGVRHTDGVNIRETGMLERNVAVALRHRRDPGVEVSVLVDLDADHPLGGDPRRLIELGVDRRTLGLGPPFDLVTIERLATTLAETDVG